MMQSWRSRLQKICQEVIKEETMNRFSQGIPRGFFQPYVSPPIKCLTNSNFSPKLYEEQLFAEKYSRTQKFQIFTSP